MQFLRKHLDERTAGFWEQLRADHVGAPAALQELARGDVSVVCDVEEAEASLAWARAHAAWTEEPAPLFVGR